MVPKEIDKAFGRSDMGRTKPPGASREVWLAHEISGDANYVFGSYDNAGEIDRAGSCRSHSQRIPA